LDFFYGSGFAESLVPVTEENDYISIRGFIGRPD